MLAFKVIHKALKATTLKSGRWTMASRPSAEHKWLADPLASGKMV